MGELRVIARMLGARLSAKMGLRYDKDKITLNSYEKNNQREFSFCQLDDVLSLKLI